MAKRSLFVLCFSTDPPAVDVVREDFILPLSPDDKPKTAPATGQARKFKWIKNKYVRDKKKQESEDVPCKILRLGTQTYLRTLDINAQGNEIPPDSTEEAVESRSKEISKQNYINEHVKDDELQNLAEDFINHGPDHVAKKSARREVHNNLPVMRSVAEKQILLTLLNNLPCFANGLGKVEIVVHKGIFCDHGLVAIWKQQYLQNPEDHFAELITHFLQPIHGVKGITALGQRGCVAVPKQIISTVLLYVLSVFIDNGGDRTTVMFDPIVKVTNMLDYWRAATKPKVKKTRPKKRTTRTTTRPTITNTTTPTHTPTHTIPHTPRHTIPQTPTHTILHTPTHTTTIPNMATTEQSTLQTPTIQEIPCNASISNTGFSMAPLYGTYNDHSSYTMLQGAVVESSDDVILTDISQNFLLEKTVDVSAY